MSPVPALEAAPAPPLIESPPPRRTGALEVARTELEAGRRLIELLTEDAAIFPSKGELRKLVQAGGISINKEKASSTDELITTEQLIDGRYLLVQRGKKNYYLLIAR